MAYKYPNSDSCKDPTTILSPAKLLAGTRSHSPKRTTLNIPKLLATVAATSLVVASAGLGTLYAWQSGSAHGPALGALTVLFALGLELCKPLAVVGVFDALRSWHFGRAALLSILALVAIAYSLTAELSLMAGARGDRVAERQEQAATSKNLHDKRQRLNGELSAIGTTRPSGAIDSELQAILTDRRLADCGQWLENWKLRATCIEKVAPLKSELATARRREALETELANLDSGKTAIEVRPDPGAFALATYLAALGIHVETAVLSEWLVLIPVVSLEIGSAFAGLLVGASRRNEPTGVQQLCSTDAPSTVAQAPNRRANEPVSAGVSDDRTGLVTVADNSERLLRLLRDRGGQLLGGQRSLASELNCSPATINRVLRELSDAGRINVLTSKAGTRVSLVTPAVASAVH